MLFRSCFLDGRDVLPRCAQIYSESDVVAAGTTPVARIGSDFLRGVSSGTESTAANLIADSFRHWLATDIQPADSTHYVGLMNAAAVGGNLCFGKLKGRRGKPITASTLLLFSFWAAKKALRPTHRHPVANPARPVSM